MQSNRSRYRFESLESRTLLTSVGWDGPGQGSADLTYYIGPTPAGMDSVAVESAIEDALDAWSDVVDIDFTQTSRPNQRDSIDFTFEQIDGRYGTLAQAYFPDDVNPARIAGDVRFDVAESWEIGNGRRGAAFDLKLVAAHEIGHAIGIEHLHSSTAVLRDSVSANDVFSGLTTADIDAALALYAAAPSNTPAAQTPLTPVSPTLTPTSTVPTQTVNLPDNSEQNDDDDRPSRQERPSWRIVFRFYPRSRFRWFGRFGGWWFG